MKRGICCLIIAGLLLPCLPRRAEAQLDSAPIEESRMGETSSSIGANRFNIQTDISDDYKLGGGDQLTVNIIVGDQALALDYDFAINLQGKIFFPSVGEITLAGLTLKQAREKMIYAVSKKYKEPFSLSLLFKNPKKIDVYVTGQVDLPGTFIVYDGTRISQVLKTAGVAKGGSDLSECVYLKRKNEKGEFSEYKIKLADVFGGGNNEKDLRLEAGDLIAVPAVKSYVYVYGYVARSGTYGYVQGQSLSDYINLAGGPTAPGNLTGVSVTRQENGHPKVYHVDASKILYKGTTENNLEIYAGDVIYVPGNFFYFSDFGSFANTILLALTLYTAVLRK